MCLKHRVGEGRPSFGDLKSCLIDTAEPPASVRGIAAPRANEPVRVNPMMHLIRYRGTVAHAFDPSSGTNGRLVAPVYHR
jgi:hypothetical protein